jgi:hypothetical protein
MAEVDADHFDNLINSIDRLDKAIENMNRTSTGGLTPDLVNDNASASSLGGQSAIADDLTKSLASANVESKTLNNSLTFLQSAFSGLGEGANSLIDSMGSFVESIPGASIVIDSLRNGISLLLTNIESVSMAIMGPMAAAFGFLSTVYDSLIQKAADLAKAGYDYARALEEIREKTGSFNETTSRTIKQTAEGLTHSLNKAAGNSKAFSSKFSPGVQGAIEKLRAIDSISTEFGATLDNLGQKQIDDASAQLFVLKKGLNFTSEAMKQTAVLAQLSGKSLKSFSQDIMASVDKIGKRWGVSTKVLGLDVGKALSNFKLLGKMTGDYVVEMTKASTYTRKLGIDINELTGIVDKFDNFESGAEAAAQLAQGFGMVLDPLTMINTEVGPRLKSLQSSFAATGRSIDSMTRQERKYLAETAGLTEQQTLLAFSAKGLSMSYDDIVAGSDAAMKKHKSTEEVINDLADNIQNVIVEFKNFTGFISAFIEGFLAGFMGTNSIMRLISQFAHQLLRVAAIGRETGKMFGTLLFGESNMAGGKKLLSLFSKFGDMAVEIAGHIRTFTSLLNGNVADAFQHLLENIMHSVDKMFGAAGGANFGSMIKKVATFMTNIVKGALQFILKEIPNIVQSLKSASGSGASDTLLSSIFGTFKDLSATIQPLLKDLAFALPELGAALIDAIVDFIKSPDNMGIKALLTGGPAMAAIGTFFSSIFDVIKTLATKWFAGEDLTKLSGDIGANFKSKMTDGITAAFAAPGDAKAAAALKTAAAGVTADVADAMSGGAAAAAIPELGPLDSLMAQGGDLIKKAGKLGAIGLGVALLPSLIEDIASGMVEVLRIFNEPRDWEGVQVGKISFLGLLKRDVEMFSNFNPDALDSAGTFLLKIIGGGILTGAAALFQSLVGKDNEVDTEAMTTTLNSLVGVLQSAIDKFTSKDVKSALQKAPTAAKNLGIISPIMESFVDIIKNTIGVLSLLPKDEDLPVTNDKSYEDKLREAIMLPFNILIDGDNSILSKIRGINLADFNKDKIENLSSIFDMLGKASTAAQEFSKTGGTKSAEVEIANASVNIMRLLEWTPSILKLGADLDDVKQMTQAETKIIGAINVTKSYLTGLSDLSEKYNSLKDVNIDLNSGVFSLINPAPPMKDSGLKQIINSFIDFKDSIAEIDLSSLDKTFLSISNTMTNYISMIESILSINSPANRSIEAVLSIVHVAETVKGILQNLGAIDIDAAIEDYNGGNNVASSAITINGGAVNVTVNMNVTMDAMKLAGQLVIAGTVEPTADFNSYLANHEQKRVFDWTHGNNGKAYYDYNGIKYIGGVRQP